MDNTKLVALGYRPEHSINETIDDLIQGILTDKNN